MRALSHCDFCGADAAGTFELLPPELEPTEDEQRRVVLCSECGTRLEDLLEPLLARAGVESTDETTATETDGSADPNRPDSADDSPTIDSQTTDSSELETTDEDTPSDSTESSRPAVIDVNAAKTDPDENEVGTDAGSDASKADADPDRPNATEPTAATDRGITLERTAGEDSSTGASTEDSSGADEDDTDSSTDEDHDVDSADDDGGSSSAADSAGDSGSPPRGYGKVIRLLRNREFPMARNDVETLAAGAYDLEPHTAEEIIEYALEDGEFQEDGDRLVRP